MKKDPSDASRTIDGEREIPRSPSLTIKKTRRWCRGKVGVLHKPVVSNYADLGKLSWLPRAKEWLVLYCSACGKELDTYSPPSEWLPPYIKKPSPVPPWAAEHLASKSA